MRIKTESLRQSESKRKELEFERGAGDTDMMSRWRFDMRTHLAVTS